MDTFGESNDPFVYPYDVDFVSGRPGALGVELALRWFLCCDAITRCGRVVPAVTGTRRHYAVTGGAFGIAVNRGCTTWSLLVGAAKAGVGSCVIRLRWSLRWGSGADWGPWHDGR